MRFLNGATVRRLLPALAVASVLGLAAFVSVPSLASGDAGYGYNCGVKGNGYHDDGKACPNRPFPGKGKGLLKFGANFLATPLGSTSEDKSTKGRGNPVDVDVTTTDSEDSLPSIAEDTSTSADTSAVGKGHGHGKGHGRGEGH